MAELDLAVRNVRIVLPDRVVEGHVYVRDGKVAAIGSVELTAEQAVDGNGLFLLPGMVDVHVHFMDPGEPEREDFPTGSAAAAVAGVTTVVEHTHARPVRDPEGFREKKIYVSERSVVDFGLAAHLSPDCVEDVLGVLEEGAVFIKVFTCETHGIQAVGSGWFYELMKRVDKDKGLFLVHAEDDGLTAVAEKNLKAAGRDDAAVIPEWRSPLAEQVAADTVGRLAEATGARVVIAHCSHPAVLDMIADYRQRGATLYAESCPQYLLLKRDEIVQHKGYRKFTPPARARSDGDLEAMWERLRDGRISYLATDHAPATRGQKEEGSIWDVPFGLPGIDTTLPLMLDAVSRGRLTWTRLVELYSAGPAKLYGLYPQKGGLEVGGDADLVLVDPSREYDLSDEMILSKAGWSPYAGRQLRGRVVATYLRGQKIAGDGRCVAPPGTGRFVPGMGARKP